MPRQQMWRWPAIWAAACLLIPVTSRSLEAATACEALKAPGLRGRTIVSAAVVAAGDFTPPDVPAGGAAPFDSSRLPAFCRVAGVLAPTADSHIEFEVWLPTAGWNGKYQGVGNGGFAGQINYADLATALSAGYAAASIATGHQASGIDARWALGHPEKLIDYGYKGTGDANDAANFTCVVPESAR